MIEFRWFHPKPEILVDDEDESNIKVTLQPTINLSFGELQYRESKDVFTAGRQQEVIWHEWVTIHHVYEGDEND